MSFSKIHESRQGGNTEMDGMKLPLDCDLQVWQESERVRDHDDPNDEIPTLKMIRGRIRLRQPYVPPIEWGNYPSLLLVLDDGTRIRVQVSGFGDVANVISGQILPK